MNDEGKPGSGHPLPNSAEAREDLIPERLVREKGHGDDERAPAQPDTLADPEGESYESRPATVR